MLNLNVDIRTRGGGLLQYYLEQRAFSMASGMQMVDQTTDLGTIVERATKLTLQLFADQIGKTAFEIDEYCFIEGKISPEQAQLFSVLFGHPDPQDFLS